MMNIECRRFDLLLSLSSIDTDSRNYIGQCDARYTRRFTSVPARQDVEVTSVASGYLSEFEKYIFDTIDIVNERTWCWVITRKTFYFEYLAQRRSLALVHVHL